MSKYFQKEAKIEAESKHGITSFENYSWVIILTICFFNFKLRKLEIAYSEEITK